MLGADFLRQHQSVDDPLSVIKPELYYPVRDAFNFPIQENFRCQVAAALLATLVAPNSRSGSGSGSGSHAASASPAPSTSSSSSASTPSSSRSSLLYAIGELLYQSHRGYSAMGLGCPETDAIISILQSMHSEGVYGGRISGGGSGGTVVVLCEQSAVERVRAQVKKFPSSRALDIIRA